jgi:diguanylate cyclase (GGDEF)-like protein/PAS domain S-box-containing protein
MQNHPRGFPSGSVGLDILLPLVGLAASGAVMLALRLWQRHRMLHDQLAARTAEVRFFRMIAEHAKDGMVVHGQDGIVTWANPAYCDLMQRPMADVLGRNPLTYALPPESQRSAADLTTYRFDADERGAQGIHTVRNQRGDGSLFWNQISVAKDRDGSDGDQVIMVCRDVTDQVDREDALRAATERLQKAVLQDPLTGLVNRAGFLRFVQQAMGQQTVGRLGLLHIDLDRFKEINDTHGHAAGDSVLIHVAGALTRILRPGDIAARLGGDEFIVACPGLPDLDALADVGKRLLEAITGTLPWEGRSLPIRASIGADLSPGTDMDLGALVQRSDFALYEAKRAGRGRLACYDEAVHQRHTAAKDLAADLGHALRSGGLSFAFQPILDLAVGQITTLETLVRWNHPRRGPLSPAEFLPLAAELGLMADLDFCAMRAALALKADLNRLRPSALTVTLNASGALLSHPDFLPRLRQCMADHALTPAEIGIEVLETVVFDAPGQRDLASEIISDLRNAGHPVMLDDFGVGYAGLAHLAHLDVSGIKIDLSLVQAAKTDPTSVRILESMIELCGHLGLTSIAEGVDTVWMATRLQDMGCSRVQGWWLSPALPAADILTWLDAHALPPPIAEPPPPLYQPGQTAGSESGDGQLSVRLSHGSGVKNLSRRKKGV